MFRYIQNCPYRKDVAQLWTKAPLASLEYGVLFLDLRFHSRIDTTLNGMK